MELLQEGISYLEKKFKGIAFDLNIAKAMNIVLCFFALALVVACSGLLACSLVMQLIEACLAIYIIACTISNG